MAQDTRDDPGGIDGPGKAAERNPWAAAALSLLQPGLGQFYNVQPVKGSVIILLHILTGFLAKGTLLFYSIPHGHSIYLFMLCLVYGFSVVDATLAAEARKTAVLARYNSFFGYLFILLGAFLVSMGALWVHKHEYLPLIAPSNTMAQTLLRGETVVVDYKAYIDRGPERGDIVLCLSPEDEEKRIVKRIVGLPGETVLLREKRVYLNGVELGEPYVSLLSAQPVPKRDNFGPLTVARDTYFVLGDNRDRSYDSRFFGTVEKDNILGKVVYLLESDYPDRIGPIGCRSRGSSARYD